MNKAINYKEIDKKYKGNHVIFKSNHGNERTHIYRTLIPPPNVTGKLHLGHALNMFLQDTIVRHKGCNNYNAICKIGTDHASIATQTKVEQMLKEKSIEVSSRDELFEHILRYKNISEKDIRDQIDDLDITYDSYRFTMDEHFTKLTTDVFIKLYEDGLIYRGNYITNWCSEIQSVVSDEEITEKVIKSKLYYIKYHVIESDEDVIIATTRLETIFADTAICYNPTDERYQKYKGMHVIVPLNGREIPFIESTVVNKEYGSGLLKVTPAHSKIDYEIGIENNLEVISVIDKNLCMINTGEMDGVSINKARELVYDRLLRHELISKVDEDNTSSIKIHGRSESPIEPLITNQWFLSMSKLSKDIIPLIEKDEIELYPIKYKNDCIRWLKGIKDWCISRQLVWGHKIPIWYDKSGTIYCSKSRPSIDHIQDENVLDTWFTSQLFVIGMYDEEQLPIDNIITGSDILNFWVNRMMMITYYLTGKVPFKKVFLHNLIKDKYGKKMSKSRGNSMDPIELVGMYGYDPVRFALLGCVNNGEYVKVNTEMFISSKKFCTKYWNIIKFLLHISECQRASVSTYNKYTDYIVDKDMYDEYDENILEKCRISCDTINDLYEKFEFSKIIQLLYGLIWDNIGNSYVEHVKIEMYKTSGSSKASKSFINKRNILLSILLRVNVLLYPIIPHITMAVNDILNKNMINYNTSDH